MNDLLHKETLQVTVVTVGPPDDDGVPTETTVQKTWTPCNVQRSSTTEIRDGNEITIVKLRASGPTAEWINENDRVTWRDRQYRVDGEPAHFYGGVLDHTEIDLIAWEGQ